MSRRFLDANIFLRHLLNDHPTRSAACLALVKAIEQGKVAAWTSDLVISEVVFVLGSTRFHHIPRDQIRDKLVPLIELPGIKLANKRIYRRVFDLYVTVPALSYVDAHTAALLERRGETELYSYDEGFDRVPTITRLEP
jgi:predicted nucleic acid-binding protein